MLRCLEILKLSILLTLFVGCQTFQSSSSKKLWQPSAWTQTTGPNKIELKLKNKSSKEVTSYKAKLYQKEFKNSDLVREKQSIVDFKVRTKKLKKTKNNLLIWELETIKKNGVFPLNTMAFPELNQKIPFTLKQNGQVVQAGSFPEDSIFYSPIIILPENKVSVGETWAHQFRWRDSEDSPVYEMKVVSTHQGYVKCGGRTCVNLDVSGSVDILGLDTDKNDFRSQMQGRIYFDSEQGSIFYAHMSSEDEFITEDYRNQSQSCLSSIVETSDDLGQKKLQCYIPETL